MKVIRMGFGYDEVSGQIGFNTPGGYIYIHSKNDQETLQALIDDLVRFAIAFGDEKVFL